MTPYGEPLGLPRIRGRFEGSVLPEEGAAKLFYAREESRMLRRRVNGYHPVLTLTGCATD
ncbi:MAG: hypothetical protein LUQ60_05640 [Methanomicrobiales archaeon]|nr:hypothetical protein [Methanomicrobiales archaeon]